MGMVNAVVPHDELETIGLEWAKIICARARRRRMLEVRIQCDRRWLDRPAGLCWRSTRLAYMTDEAVEGRDAFREAPAGLDPVSLLLLELSNCDGPPVGLKRRSVALVTTFVGVGTDSRQCARP